jgi:integrase/recombinase XerD
MQIRNYSPKTINSYVCSLISLARYYNLSPEAISREQLKVYIHYLVETKKVSFTTINQLISALKILQHDVLGNDWEQVKVKRPRNEKKLPVVLSKDEVEKLIQTTENIKHKVIIALAYSSGLRKEEVQTLKPSDIDSNRMTVSIR